MERSPNLILWRRGERAVPRIRAKSSRRRGQRGKSEKTMLLIDRAKAILAGIQPAGVRAICYRLFVNGWLLSMGKSDTDTVSRHLVWAREQEIIPWDWIVDETRPEERDPQWA